LTSSAAPRSVRRKSTVLTRRQLKAAQEYAGKHDRIVELGRHASLRGEVKFLELCKQAGYAEPERLARQLNLILQGALALAQTSGDLSPFLLAKDTASAVLEKAELTKPAAAKSKRRQR
jgi:hypothetical protein